MPECLASTQRLGSACEIREFLLDHVSFIVNLAANRLTTLGGARQNPEEQDVTIAFDWLQALRDAHLTLPEGDGLFCVLRDEPPDDDVTQGGTGLLDRAAESEASRILAEDDPLVGNDETPALELPDDDVAEIEGVIADPTIAPEDRFDALSGAARATLREAVLTQRIGRFTTRFNGSSGQLRLPSADYELLSATFQLEEFLLQIAQQNAIEELTIRGDAPGQEIALTLHFAGLNASFSHTREPGEHFWITAAGVLVAAFVILPSAFAVILGLAALGGPGVLIIASLLGAAAGPSAALLLAVALFLLWENALIDVSVGDFRMRMTFNREFNNETHSAVVLATDDVELEGTITVTYDSQIPSGIHQILGWFTEGIVNIFDAARGRLQETLEGGISRLLSGMPHLVLPTPNRLRLEGDVVVQNTVVGLALEGTEGGRHATQVLADISLHPRNAGLFMTQVDPNALPALRSVIDAYAESIAPAYGGYGFSQNLLNACVYGSWAIGTFERDLAESEANAVYAALGALADKCAQDESREVHVWSAAPPRVLLTPYAFWADKRRPYLQAIFDDLRLCVGCGKGKEHSILEFKYGVRVAAHVGLGRQRAGGEFLSLIMTDMRFVNVYYDTCLDAISVEPVETQSVGPRGEAFATVAEMDDAARVTLLNSLQEVFRVAAARALDGMPSSLIPFEDPSTRWDRHVYDGFLVMQMTPVRTGLYAVIAPLDRIRAVLPPEEGGNPLIDFVNLNCEQARNWFRGI